MQKPVGILLATLVAILSAVLLWGVAIEPRLILAQRVERAEIPNLPPDWEGAEVAVVGDFQVGMWLDNVGMVRQAVSEIVERRPALALITGDFVYGPEDEGEGADQAMTPVPKLLLLQEQSGTGDTADEAGAAALSEPWRKPIQTAVAALRPLIDAGIPVYTVLGNHDFGMSAKSELPKTAVARTLTAGLEAAGVTVLMNAAVPLAQPGAADAPASAAARAADTLWLGGVGPVYPKLADAEAMLDRIPADAPRIVLMHNPSAFEDLPADSAPLALAGHTHGGQIRIPGLPFWSWLSIVRAGEVHADGWITDDDGAAGNRLYVNRGIGFSIAPVRINCAPELTWFRLTRAPIESNRRADGEGET
jgi:uncharacterized protein